MSSLRRSSAVWASAAAALVAAAIFQAVPAASPAQAARHVAVGAYLPAVERQPQQLDRWARIAGRPAALVEHYRKWPVEPFDHDELAALTSRGGVPLVTWEPWTESDEPVSLRAIAAGAYDEYVAEAARNAAAWDGLLYLRFAHEMNGGWYPWGRGNNGNTPAAYRAAWRHLVSIFKREGAGNVRWVWCPYAAASPKLSFKRYFPGDRWVDWVGLDGFNWGSPWVSFGAIFNASYRKLTRLSRRPLMIPETGSVEGRPGAKARWVSQALRRTLPRLRRVRALVWWSDVHPDGADFEVDSSRSAARALRRGLRARLYATPRRAKRGARSSSAASAAAGGHKVALGVYAPGLFVHPARIGRYARRLGRPPLIVSEYKQWDFAPFVRSELGAVWQRGAQPFISWEPLSYRGRRYPLRKIARGRYDRYVRKAARAAAAWGKPILLRFAHEMNGDWYPWGRGVDGNTPRLYKRAWRRLVRIFRRAGARNVRWVWCPNVNQGDGLRFANLYPGDRWVDWVGLDGFNWGYGGSRSFHRIFDPSLRSLARIAPRKPVVIAETGTYDRGKARWIRQALTRQLPPLRRIRALVWFNQWVNGVDMRFDGTGGGLRAMRQGARRGLFATTRERLLAGGR